MESSAAGDPSTTTVSMRAYHVLQIDGYSRTFDAFFYVNSINSYPFRAGGYTWLIRLFPKLDNGRNTDFISLFLVLVDIVDEPVIAESTFSLLDDDKKPVLSYTRTTGMVNFAEFGPRGWGCYDFIKRRGDFERSKFIKDDCFAIRVDIHIVKKVPASSMVVPPPSDDMHQHLLVLLSSKEGADIEFQVGGETFTAHRLVLVARSSVFRAEFSTLKTDDRATNVIRIDDMEAPVFRAMLSFIYTDAWPYMDGCEDEFAMTQLLLVAADRYNLQRLKLLCEDKLCNHIGTGSVVTILALAEKHHCAGLKDACFEFLGYSTNLFAVTETEEFKRSAQICPAITKKLMIFSAITRYREKGKIAGWSSQGSVIKIPISSNAENSEYCSASVV